LVKNQGMQVSLRWKILWTSTFSNNFLKWPCCNIIAWSCQHRGFRIRPIFHLAKYYYILRLLWSCPCANPIGCVLRSGVCIVTSSMCSNLYGKSDSDMESVTFKLSFILIFFTTLFNSCDRQNGDLFMKSLSFDDAIPWTQFWRVYSMLGIAKYRQTHEIVLFRSFAINHMICFRHTFDWWHWGDQDPSES
jgi:hypothetical protein